MAFTDFQKHCPECRKGKPCGKAHVYALELDRSILRGGWFSEANPDYIEGRLCLYVGETGHLPKCRASAHQHCKKKGGAWEGKTYFCYCGGMGRRIDCTKGSKGAKERVAKHNKFTLIPKLFKEIEDEDGNKLGNPIQKNEDRKKREESLAKHLKSLGYGVWYG